MSIYTAPRRWKVWIHGLPGGAWIVEAIDEEGAAVAALKEVERCRPVFAAMARRARETGDHPGYSVDVEEMAPARGVVR